MNDPVLKVKDLTVSSRKDGKSILQGISFEIQRGKVTGIVGESGSGKSVTALSVMRLLPPALAVTGGEIVYSREGKVTDVLTLNRGEINALRGNHISMIFQEPMTSLNPSMKCGLQIDEVLRMHTSLGEAERKNHIISLFDQVKLPRVNEIFGS